MTLVYLTPLALVLAAPAVPAHEVWIERDGTGPARIYLGEPGEMLPDGGAAEFDHLQTPKLLPASKAAMTRKAGCLEVAVPAGDVRAHDDTVFAPWGPDDKKEGSTYFARAGRTDANDTLPFEIAPVSAGSDRFVVVRDGRPVADTEVTVAVISFSSARHLRMKNSTGTTNSIASPFTSSGGLGSGAARVGRSRAPSSKERLPEERSNRTDSTLPSKFLAKPLNQLQYFKI